MCNQGLNHQNSWILQLLSKSMILLIMKYSGFKVFQLPHQQTKLVYTRPIQLRVLASLQDQLQNILRTQYYNSERKFVASLSFSSTNHRAASSQGVPFAKWGVEQWKMSLYQDFKKVPSEDLLFSYHSGSDLLLIGGTACVHRWRGKTPVCM